MIVNSGNPKELVDDEQLFRKNKRGEKEFQMSPFFQKTQRKHITVQFKLSMD